MNDRTDPEFDREEHDRRSDAGAGRRMGIGAGIITVFLGLGKVLGYVREIIIAGLGADASTDAYKVVYNSVLFTVYVKVEKLLRPTFLPEFVKVRREENEQQAWNVGSVITGVQFLLLLAVAAICVIYARPILLFVGKGLTDSPKALNLAVVMLRIVGPSLLLYSLSVMPELTLHAYKSFTLPAVAEAVRRFAVVAIGLLLLWLVWPYQSEEAIYAIAWGVMIGGCLRFFVQLPGLWSKLSMFRAAANVFANASAKRIFSLMPPVLIGVVFSTFRTWADSRFGTDIAEGAYSCLDFGRKIPDLFLQTLALAVTYVVYPFISDWAVRVEKDKMAEALMGMTRAMLFVYVPLSVALMIVSLPIIKLIYQAGDFTNQDAAWSAVSVYWYSPGLPFFSVEGSINKWFFALQDTMTPNITGAFFAVVHIIIGYLGVYVFGTSTRTKLSWVAAAYTISKSAKVVTLYGLLKKHIGKIDWRKQAVFALKLILCVGPMGIAVYLLQGKLVPALHPWQPPVGGLKAKAAVNLLASFTLGVPIYFGIAWLLGIEELSVVGEAIQKGLKKVRSKLGLNGE